MNRRKTHRKLLLESIPMKIMMQGDFLGREKRMWVARVPFLFKKSENPQGTTLRMFCEKVWPRSQPEGGGPRVVREWCRSRWRSVGELCGHRGGRSGALVPFRSSEIPFGGEAEYHDHGGLEAQGSSHLRVDLVDAVQKHDVQHYQREDDIGPIEGVVKYVRKFVRYGQGVFDAEVVQSTNV
ncbi:uncharacterized protein LOC111441681 [Cucurbita moschata]|uniref:Uncharacterized protein LOC111441681 n=1 Tax=Cucurbita moschata TaxID=3662 RepID=A0A6J1F7Z0_CUCMO|nr:uncharacterized protein LOC111441681 [Cucurbita moschata]